MGLATGMCLLALVSLALGFLWLFCRFLLDEITQESVTY